MLIIITLKEYVENYLITLVKNPKRDQLHAYFSFFIGFFFEKVEAYQTLNIDTSYVEIQIFFVTLWKFNLFYYQNFG